MIEYREATARDAEAVAMLHVRSWRESYRGSFTDEFLGDGLPAERLGVWRERLGRSDPEQLVVLATDGEDLCGFVCVYGAQDPEWGSFVDNLHVAASCKRRGVGSTLMARAGAWLGDRHPDDGVYLWVLEVNASARRFYESIGAINSGVTTMETHGGVVVRSCRYTWPDPRSIAGP